MLQVSQLHQYYGGSHILRGVDFSARQGEVTCLLGRNGVGKTTLLKCLMGLIPARSGEAVSYTHLRAHETRHDLVCRLLLEKKKNKKTNKQKKKKERIEK